ncbi:MAG: succinate dehydrogenase/fumarate reductase iron-sulfur subunit [Candidatus Sumerlaeia bacterium]|nr:succinate dehydrogenase/fumarate reductase iron-sulfur subunit [Candidatus Sumerlaeia bacterium]
MAKRTFRLFRGNRETGGDLKEYTVECDEGMVVLDAVHRVQAEHAPDLACRWNCKAGKCGSCSAEVNGKPRLMCMTRLSDYPPGMTLTITPMRAFKSLRDLVTDVSKNYENNRRLPHFQPRRPDFPDGEFRMFQYEVERPQEFRKCIECFLCQDVCHVLRTHEKHEEFIGPAFFVRAAVYEMHPADEGDRLAHVKEEGGIGYCNITKCCTEVCPEHIHITDNAIIPLKERVADRHYDPLRWLLRKLTGRG